jgi:hypothetical protein
MLEVLQLHKQVAQVEEVRLVSAQVAQLHQDKVIQVAVPQAALAEVAAEAPAL